jgi:DNA-directed RNA polymerase sigma subunit (sigma70/sigma32)
MSIKERLENNYLEPEVQDVFSYREIIILIDRRSGKRTYKEIGNEWGIGPERVRQILAKTYAKIRAVEKAIEKRSEQAQIIKRS